MKISFFEKNFLKKFSKSGISPKLSSDPNLASYYIKPRALGGLIFSVTRFHIYPEYVWRSNTLQNFQLAPWGGAQKSPKRPKFGPKLPKRSSEPNLESYYKKPRALRGLIFYVTRFQIHPEYVWRRNTLQNFQLAPWGGLKSPPREQNLGQIWQKGALSQIEHLIT